MMEQPQSNNQLQQRKRRRNSDWQQDFYKNGYPKEVIVISDTPTPPPPPPPPSTLQPSFLNSDYALNNRPQQESNFQPKRAKWTHDAQGSNGLNQSILAFHLFPSQYNQQQQQQQHQYQHSSLRDNNKITHNTNNASSSSTTTITTTTTTTTTIATTSAKTATTEVPAEVYDDKDGHYIVRPNESLTDQYKIMRLLGQGTFGKVVECFDRVRRTFCAIKIIRAVPKYRDASKIEIRVLNTLKQHDPLNLNKCIHLVEWFDYRNHICMVFELLGQSVFDYMKSNRFKPFPPNQLSQLAKQLITSVAFLHDLNLIHTDLKPENILLVNPPTNRTSKLSDTDIRLIDFGSATFQNDYHSTVVSTRHYRAPEIILGMGWSFPCDIWSIGCILVEFLTGDALFQTHEDLEHLTMMETVLGPIPSSLKLSKDKNIKNFFFKKSQLLRPTTSKSSKNLVQSLRPLKDLLPPTSMYNIHLFDLLQKMFIYNPAERITARGALRHPFFA